jgi:hypothetical protein
MKHGIFRFWWPLAALAFAALFGFAVMALWNWLLPAVAGLPEITFLQALGLLALSRILFGGLGGMGRAMGVARRGGDREHINPFRDEWRKMSAEDRKEFIRKHSLFNAHINRHIFGGCGDEEPDPNNGKDKK